jgi:putative N-acetylmannosamine-6-phosphate epimerase
MLKVYRVSLKALRSQGFKDIFRVNQPINLEIIGIVSRNLGYKSLNPFKKPSKSVYLIVGVSGSS